MSKNLRWENLRAIFTFITQIRVSESLNIRVKVTQGHNINTF